MPTIYCRHIKTNGRRCLSPAMRGQALCYFHSRINARHRTLSVPTPPPQFPQDPQGETIIHPLNVDPGRLQRDPIMAEYYGLAPLTPANATLSLPALEDRESIQVALSLSLQALAQNRVDAKRAYTLLFGLQVASRNAEKLDLGSSKRVVVDALENEAGEELAPDEDPIEVTETEALLNSLGLDDEDEDEQEDDQDDEEEGQDEEQEVDGEQADDEEAEDEEA